MRRIVHLSDIHFGCADPTIVDALIPLVHRLDPHVVAVSGDLTQRARRRQFEQAREFLDALPRPQIVVPGNHDVPLYNVVARFLDPLANYTRYITGDLRPVHTDEEVAVVGLDTTRSLTVKDGKFRPEALRHACAALEGAGDHVARVVVAHHPFEYPDDASRPRQKATALRALEALSRSGADVFLTGHLHVSYTGHTALRYRIAGRSAIVVEAGTATSTRVRGEGNAFNLLHLERGRVCVERWRWDAALRTFQARDACTFARSDGGWEPEGPPSDHHA